MEGTFETLIELVFVKEENLPALDESVAAVGGSESRSSSAGFK